MWSSALHKMDTHITWTDPNPRSVQSRLSPKIIISELLVKSGNIATSKTNGSSSSFVGCLPHKIKLPMAMYRCMLFQHVRILLVLGVLTGYQTVTTLAIVWKVWKRRLGHCGSLFSRIVWALRFWLTGLHFQKAYTHWGTSCPQCIYQIC